MKPAAFVTIGASLAATLPELRALDAKVFATPDACLRLESEGIHAVPLLDPVGVEKIHSFGHKEIHLFGFDLCNDGTEGHRICLENRVFYTTEAAAAQASELLAACMRLSEKNVQIAVHGDGLFAQMANSVMKNAQERILTAVYDLNVCPPTYEILSFLSQAEKYRVEHGFTGIDVVFLPGPMHGFRDDGLPPSVEHRQSMLHRICVSATRLLPSVRNVHVFKARTLVEGDVFPPDWTNERPTFVYGPAYQKDGYRCLRATDAARAEIKRRFPKPYTTITMREAEYWPQRNSNFAAWSRAARELQFSGTPAVVVPDTHGSGLPGVASCPEAAWDVDLRLALYEGAVMNLGVSNGPMVLMMFSVEPCPYLLFQCPAEDTPTGNKFLEEMGMKEGDSWSKNGRTVWSADTPEAVVSEIAAWLKEGRVAA